MVPSFSLGNFSSNFWEITRPKTLSPKNSNFSLFEIGNQRLGNNNSGIELKLGENYLDNCPGETYRIMFNIMGNGNALWVNCESYATLNQWNQYTIVFETGIAKL